MKKLFYLGFCVALVAGFGCAVTDYPLITDNNQTRNDMPAGVGYTVNTNGKAHIIEGIYAGIALITPDGYHQVLWFVDQKANGDQTLFTYDNFSTGYPIFHSDLYCNPDWTGCALLTADNPVVNDNPLDYKYDIHCKGANTLYYITIMYTRYGECGRAKANLADRIATLNMGRLGRSMGVDGLFYDLNNHNTTITLNNNAGFVTSLPVTADATVFQGQGRNWVDMSNPLVASMGRAYADFLANHATSKTTVTLTYNGIAMNWDLATNNSVSNAAHTLANMNAHY